MALLSCYTAKLSLMGGFIDRHNLQQPVEDANDLLYLERFNAVDVWQADSLS